MRLAAPLRRSFLALVSLVVAVVPARAQVSLAPATPRGLTVTPVYEGWYRLKDGSFVLSFGYYNRNSEEVVEVPVGADNQLAPGAQDQGQPSTFHPDRHWGVFGVKVPADFGKKEVVWTLKVRGKTFAIPGTLHPDWEIDALEGEASFENTPPAISLAPGGPEGQGPMGVSAGPLRVGVGVPLSVTATIRDDGKTSTVSAAGVRTGGNVTLAWFKHQGPGTVTFGTGTSRIAPLGGTATTTATFSAPGSYIIRVRATDSAVESAGHSQCCWTNGFIRVTVTP